MRVTGRGPKHVGKGWTLWTATDRAVRVDVWTIVSRICVSWVARMMIHAASFWTLVCGVEGQVRLLAAAVRRCRWWLF